MSMAWLGRQCRGPGPGPLRVSESSALLATLLAAVATAATPPSSRHFL